ncbi:130_t:CDS:2 [Entrophospora sp. SA101]|nr:130_t:CDS:2 [Entrophospora sp. SA101]
MLNVRYDLDLIFGNKPKGGWENDETEQEAAARETYEEAGARGRVISFIGAWDHDINKSTGLPKAMFSFFEMEVDQLEDRWPEMDERDRQWVCLLLQLKNTNYFK